MRPPRFLPLRPGDAVTRWALAEPEERHFPGLARPMPDRVDYRFVNGWVETGDLPCREALLAIRRNNDRRSPTRPEARFLAIHLTGESRDADFSRFCHRPTLIRRLLGCALRGRGPARFRLATCGGVRLWLNDEPVASFQPYTRNRPAVCEVSLDLRDEGQLLTVELEDLHERDTTCFVSLMLVEGHDVAAALPALDGGTAEAEVPDALLGALAALRTDRVFATEGTVRLICDPPPDAPLELLVSEIGPFARGGIAGRSGHLPDIACTLSPDAPAADLFSARDGPQGCIGMTVVATCDGVTLRRALGTTVLGRSTRLGQDDLAGRKRAALAAIRAEAAFDPSVALAILAAGAPSAQAEAIVAAALDAVERRDDCCDFSLLPLLRILRDHPAALPDELRARLRAAVLGFRYWLSGPGDDVMWFWSENHVACFHICQLVAGRMLPNETFSNSGRRGRDLADEAALRLGRWFDAIERDGLGEWNSAAYYPIDMLALLSLHDMVPKDDPLRRRAAALIDRIFVMAGLHTTGGVPAGSQGRAYEKELLAGPATELGSLVAIAFGGEMVPAFDRAAALFCLSDYAPPPLAARLARPGTTLEARYTQGLDHLGKLSLWKSSEVQLSSVADHKTGEPGHQQHAIDVQCTGHPMARLWINHPGELKEWGERRPSLLAGNARLPRVAQAGPVALLIHDAADTEIGFTQLFAPFDAFDDIAVRGGWRILSSGGARVAVWCSTPLAAVGGQYERAILRACARRTGWIVAVGGAELDAVGGADSDAAAGPGDPEFDPDVLTLSARIAGRRLDLSHTGPLRVDGAPVAFEPLTPEPRIGIGGGPLIAWHEVSDDAP